MLKSEIIELIAEVNPAVAVPEAETDKSLFDLGLDSLDHASILLAVEEKYDIKIGDDDAGDLVTVDGLVAFVEKAQSA